MIWHHDSNFFLQDWASAKQWKETRWNEKESKMKSRIKQELIWTHFNVMKHRWNWNKSESHLSQIWARCLKDEMRWDEMHFNVMMHEKLKHIWITSESDLNEMFESDLNKIWVKSEQKKDKMQFNMMMHKWN